jgi:hypothetical protein
MNVCKHSMFLLLGPPAKFTYRSTAFLVKHGHNIIKTCWHGFKHVGMLLTKQNFLAWHVGMASDLQGRPEVLTI